MWSERTLIGDGPNMVLESTVSNTELSLSSEKVFVSQERVSGFPEKGLTSGEVRELPGKFGKLPGNLWIAVKLHSERTSGEVTEKLPGKFGELPGNSEDFPEARGSLTPSQ